MKPYTREQLETSLHASQRTERPLSGDQKLRFLEQLVVPVKPWYQRLWPIWIVLPVGAMTAIFIWYVIVQTPTAEPQLANTTAQPVILDNSNSDLVTNTPIETPETNTNTETQPELLPQRTNSMNQYFYFGLGGGLEYDYSVMQFIDPQLTTEPTTANLRQRNLLSQAELEVLAKQFAVQADQIVYTLETEQLTETECSQYFLQPAPTTCLNLTALGAIHYLPADGYGPTLTGTIQLIAEVTGLPSSGYASTDLGPVEGSPDFEHYHIYYQASLTEGLIYRDLGWDVYLYHGKLHSLRGYVLPNLSVAGSINIVSPSEALARLHAGFQPLDRTTNPNSTRMVYSQFYLDNLVLNSPEPVFQLSHPHLEYSLATQGNQLVLLPVFYVVATDQVSGKSLDVYIDPSTAGDLFSSYQLVIL
jgi:hypothetical protein